MDETSSIFSRRIFESFGKGGALIGEFWRVFLGELGEI